MTRLALLADIHSDADALVKALKMIADLGCSHIVCAGDAIDYDLPSGTEEKISLLCDHDVICISGNHERRVLAEDREDHLSRASVEWLRSLPMSWRSAIDGVRVAVWHARPSSDMGGVDEGMIATDEVPGLLAEDDVNLR